MKSTTGKGHLIARRTIVTHHWTHADEGCAIALLKRYAAALGFEDIETFGFAFVDAGSSVPSYLISRDWKKEEIIPFGVWGEWAPFDEHVHPESGDSCSSLVLKYLKQEIPEFDDPCAETLVTYVTRIDRRGGALKHSIPDVIKSMNSAGNEMAYADRDENEIRTIRWASEGFAAYLDRGKPKEKKFEAEVIATLIADDAKRSDWLSQYYEAANWKKNRFNEAVEWLKQQEAHGLDHFYKVDGPHGEKITIIAVESDHPDMHNALFAYGAHVVIIKKQSGQVAILTTSKQRILLYGLAGMLRREEFKFRKDESYKQLTPKQLSSNGTLGGWCFNESHRNQSLLNGSNSAPDVDPTRIPFRRIVRMAVLALDESCFSTKKDGHVCDGKHCDSSKSTPCSFYWYGLHRCHELRINGLKQRQDTDSTTIRQPKPTAKIIPIAPAPKAKPPKQSTPAPVHKPAQGANTAMATQLTNLRSVMKY